MAIKEVAFRSMPKLATGIQGFDALSHGGLPQNRTSLVIGAPGSGKSIFAMQTLVHAARVRKEPGIFVAFEESPEQIVVNSATFDWGLTTLNKNKLCLVDAHLSATVAQSGQFDLTGMLAILQAKKDQIGARWVVFDGIDVLLMMLQDPIAELREIHRVRDWLADNGLTGIITAKVNSDSQSLTHYDYMQFMTDCVVRLDRRLEQGVSVHRVEIKKYRGSGFATGEFPLRFGPSGMEVNTPEPAEISHKDSNERVSSGFGSLDSLLGGGLYRGSTTLITGAPGTAKTTLTGAFIDAACQRHERSLFVSFDEGADLIIRNLSSVGIQLKRHVRSKMLLMYSGRMEACSAEEHLTKLRSLIEEHKPRCMVIDPLSALIKTGNPDTARSVVSRLVYMVKDFGITVIFTSLLGDNEPRSENTELEISTVADTWIHLSYLVRNGERNRALSIIKSRGTWHSNQVRELTLSNAGPALTDVYTAGGDVLMGTLRWEKEAEQTAIKKKQGIEFEYKRSELEFAEADIHARIKALQLDLQRQRGELALYSSDHASGILTSSETENQIHRMRNEDPAKSSGPGPKRRGAADKGASASHKAPKGNGNAS